MMKKVIALALTTLALCGMAMSAFAAGSPVKTEEVVVESAAAVVDLDGKPLEKPAYMTATGNVVTEAPLITVQKMDAKSEVYQALGTEEVKGDVAAAAKADNKLEGDVVVQPLTAVKVEITVGKNGEKIVPSQENPVYVSVNLPKELNAEVTGKATYIVVMGYNEISGKWEKVEARIVNGKVVVKLTKRYKNLAINAVVPKA